LRIVDCDQRVVDLVNVYVRKLGLPDANLSITTNRSVFSGWIGRTIPFRVGGAYSMHPETGEHRVFVHLERLDLAKPWAIEVVVAEELIHMRDHSRGDFRRHSHHGYDRIAAEVERVTGFTPEQQRDIFGPRNVRKFRHFFQCPNCRMVIVRRRRGTWVCRECRDRFRRQYLLVEVPASAVPPEARETMEMLNQRLNTDR